MWYTCTDLSNIGKFALFLPQVDHPFLVFNIIMDCFEFSLVCTGYCIAKGNKIKLRVYHFDSHNIHKYKTDVFKKNIY